MDGSSSTIPTIVAMIVSEFPFVQPHLYDTQIPPVVYLSGVLMFVAGLAIVRVHNRWARDWTVLVTLAGWFSGTLGLFRMFAAGAYQQGASPCCGLEPHLADVARSEHHAAAEEDGQEPVDDEHRPRHAIEQTNEVQRENEQE